MITLTVLVPINNAADYKAAKEAICIHPVINKYTNAWETIDSFFLGSNGIWDPHKPSGTEDSRFDCLVILDSKSIAVTEIRNFRGTHAVVSAQGLLSFLMER